MEGRFEENHLNQLGQVFQLIHIECREQAGEGTADNNQECCRVIQRADRRALDDHTYEYGDKTAYRANDS